MVDDKEVDQHNERENAIAQEGVMQAELVHSEKLKALGMMSAGLAHEINNPLNYAVLGLELLKEEGRNMLAPEYARTVADIEDGLMRIKHIVRDLKNFSHKDSADSNLTETFLVGDMVASASRMVSKSTEGIAVPITLDTPYRVVGDVSSITQVLVNLMTNSVDSVREKLGDEGGEIAVHGVMSGERYVIQVVDNGVGISKDDIENIFTPFFTTKPVNTGTGLGLSVCHAIIDRHGGKIKVESILGQWTSISFDLAIA